MSDRQWYVLARLAGVTIVVVAMIMLTVVVARIGEGAALAVALIVLSGVVQWVTVSDQRILLHFRHARHTRTGAHQARH